MPYELIKMDEELYKRILLIKEHLRHDKATQTIHELIQTFPFEAVDLMDKIIFELNAEKDYKEIVLKAVKLYCLDIINKEG